MGSTKKNNVIKGSFWGAFAFYFLIAFEFFYMAGPFAMYFYSVYAPVLNFFNNSPTLAWLSRFFLPHAVRSTSSILINSLEVVGVILAIIGFLAFCVGAIQVYYYKLAKKGIVIGGIYNIVRHPQYASFIVCSFGLLILWPRYIVAILFVTMVFFYYLLAKVEEAECENKFGQSYIEFKNRTSMFLPFRLSFLPKLPKNKVKKIILIAFFYIISIVIILSVAKGLNKITIDSLYTTYSKNTVNIALSKLSEEKINEILSIALSDAKITKEIEKFGKDAYFINYVLPTEWFAAEIPMNGIQRGKGHKSSTNYDPNLFKAIFTKAVIRDGTSAEGKDILKYVYLREPIIEVWVDLTSQTITKILDMPEEIMYEGVPVAIY